MATHSSTLAWKIPWTEEPGRLQSMGSLGVGHDWATSLSLFTFMHWRRKWQPTPVFLAGESQGRGSLVGCRPWGRRVGHDWSDLAAAVLVAQFCWTLCDPTDCGPPGSSVRGILHATILEWIAIPFSRGSSQSRNRTWVSCIAGRFFSVWATGKIPRKLLRWWKCMISW